MMSFRIFCVLSFVEKKETVYAVSLLNCLRPLNMICNAKKLLIKTLINDVSLIQPITVRLFEEIY